MKVNNDLKSMRNKWNENECELLRTQYGKTPSKEISLDINVHVVVKLSHITNRQLK